jgi:hypothetical protein
MSATLPALIALAAIAGLPQPPNDPGAYRIRAKVEMIALPTAAALRLLPRLHNVYQCECACLELQRLVRSGEAELLDQPTVVTESDVRVQSVSGPEFRWPTEFEPPAIAGTFANSAPTHREPRWGAITPYSFESDTLGAHLELETVLDRDLTQQISIAASLATLDGWREFLGPADPHGVIGVIRQPIISRYKVQASLALRPGTHKLLGSFTCAQPQPHVIVFILSATATRLDSPPPAK